MTFDVVQLLNCQYRTNRVMFTTNHHPPHNHLQNQRKCNHCATQLVGRNIATFLLYTSHLTQKTFKK